jgi:hypothetical protein
MSAPSFQVGWLVLDDAEQRRARDYLRQFRDEGTLDELGFAQVRDAFAEVFYPATNTIMTRTRYLFFLTATFGRIERERRSGRVAAELLRRLENELREQLVTTSKEESSRGDMGGIIGASAKDDLQRYPSSIYWNALKRLGLFRRANWSLRFYLDHLAHHYEQSRPRHDDDRSSHALTNDEPTWDPEVEEACPQGAPFLSNKGFAPGMDFRLTNAEARYLQKRFAAALTDGKPTLLAHLLDIRHADDFAFPWDVPCPPALQSIVDHAQAFSVLAKGTTLQYYDLLIEEQRAGGVATAPFGMEKPFAEWWLSTRRMLSSWNFADFSQYIEKKVEPRIYGQKFLRDWLKLCRDTTDGASLLHNPGARQLVRERETAVRPTKHRLGQLKYLRQWKAPESLDAGWYSNPKLLPYLLDYRSTIGAVFVQEITAGLKRRS